MSALPFILACIKFLTAFTMWAQERNLMQAGADQVIAAQLRKMADDIKLADEARAGVLRSVRDGGLRDHDEDERPD